VHIVVNCQSRWTSSESLKSSCTLGAGVAFLSFDIYDMPPVHALPLGRTSEDLVDEEGNPTQGAVRACTSSACTCCSVSNTVWWLASAPRGVPQSRRPG
jgi:hypothetical protein